MIALHKICDSPADILRQPNRKRSEPFPISAILPFTPSRALTPYVMRATDNDRASTIVPVLCLAPGNYLLDGLRLTQLSVFVKSLFFLSAKRTNFFALQQFFPLFLTG